MPQTKTRVPVELIRPYVVKHVDEMQATEMGAVLQKVKGGSVLGITTEDTEVFREIEYDAASALAFRAHLDESLVRRIYRGEKEYVTYETVDKLFGKGMHNFLLWYEPELLPYYLEGAEVPPDLSKPVKCKNPQCDEWFAIEHLPTGGVLAGTTQVSQREYCSGGCKTKAWQLRNPGAASRATQKHREKNREAYNAYMRAYRARKRVAA